jgi:hypothetical protein
MSQPLPDMTRCSECGAAIEVGDSRCWLCGRQAGADAPIVAQLVEPPALARPQFTLSTMMLIITLICVCLGVVSIAPGLIVPLLAIVVPALFRTISATKRAGRDVTLADRVATFLTSIGVVFLAWIGGLVAFAAACFTAVGIALGAGGMAGDAGITLAIVLSIAGVLFAVGVIVTLLVKTWPKQK